MRIEMIETTVEPNLLERDGTYLLKKCMGPVDMYPQAELRIWSETEVEAFRVRTDVYIPCLNMAVFFDGSFWHDQRRRMSSYGIRQVASGRVMDDVATEEKGFFWLTKARENRRRDRQVNKALRSAGVVVVRLKEDRISGKNPLAYVSTCLANAIRPVRAAAAERVR